MQLISENLSASHEDHKGSTQCDKNAFTFAGSGRGVGNTHNSDMGFVQGLSRCSLQEALPDGKTQQQAARQLKSLGPLISDLAPLRDYTLVYMTIRVWIEGNAENRLMTNS